MSPTRTSAAALLWLQGVPRWMIFVAMIAVACGAAFLPGWPGEILLLLIIGFLSWLAFMSWPKTEPTGRVLRVIVIGVLVAVAVTRFAK